MIKQNKKLSYVLIALVLLIIVVVAIVLFNPNKDEKVEFEKINLSFDFTNGAEDFSIEAYDSDEATTLFNIDNEYFYNDKGSLHINNLEDNDSRYTYELELKKGHYYTISAWVATEDVGESNIGANISILGNHNKYFGNIKGTQGWTKVEANIHATENVRIEIAFRIGGYASTNSGQAWFDNVSIESFENAPNGVSKFDIYEIGELKSNDAAQIRKEIHYNTPPIAALIVTFVIFALIYFSLYKSGNKEPFAKGYGFLFVILGFALVARLLMAPYAKGFSNDINLFKAWGMLMSQDPIGFYDKVAFCDYPPFYIYILGLFCKVATLLGIDPAGTLFTLVIKSPPIIADIISGYLIFKLTEGKMKENWRLFFVALYVFNPMTILDSAVWGQVDAIWAMFVLLAVNAVADERYNLSSFLFALAIMVKPQGVFVGPVLLFAVLKKKDSLQILKSGAIIIGTMAAAWLPYLIQNGPLWVFEMFGRTAGGYKYASVNSFNFFAMLGLNWVPDNNTFLSISYFTWGIIFLIVVVLLAGYIYFKISDKYKTLPYLLALMLSVCVVVFTVRMHERYMFPAIIFSLIVAFMDNSRFMLGIHGTLTVTSFLNSLIILGRHNSGGSISDFTGDNFVFVISAINVITAILIVVYAFKKLKQFNENKNETGDLMPVINSANEFEYVAGMGGSINDK